MAEVVVENNGYKPSSQRQTLISSVLIGLIAGIVGWLLSMALQRWVISSLFCQSTDTYSVCANGGTVSWAVAVIVVGIFSLFIMVSTGIFRPLLVVLASIISLWGASAWLGPLEWWQSMLWHGLLFALAYAFFAWIARIDKFLISLIITIIAIVLARLVAISA
jgi:hypothetical protein